MRENQTMNFRQRVADEANAASKQISLFAERLRLLGEYAEADDANELALELRRLAVDAVLGETEAAVPATEEPK